MPRPDLSETETAILELSAHELGVEQSRLSTTTRPVQDLGIDSLDIIEWLMAIEDRFQVSLPDADKTEDQAYKEVFAREDFTLGDMAEAVYLRWGSGAPPRQSSATPVPSPASTHRSTQLGGVHRWRAEPRYRPLGRNSAGVESFRRSTDGMTCLLLPGGEVEIGSDDAMAGSDERPLHHVILAPFLMDQEIVSTTAYCRFLNSIGEVDEDTLAGWFLIRPHERRHHHQVIALHDAGWRPVAGTEDWPMVLVSWFGASAYALWANGGGWSCWRNGPSAFLPSEAQWEYAARGIKSVRWPWGDRDPGPGEINAEVITAASSMVR